MPNGAAILTNSVDKVVHNGGIARIPRASGAVQPLLLKFAPAATAAGRSIVMRPGRTRLRDACCDRP